MAHTRSAIMLDPDQQKVLLSLARDSIRQGLQHGRPMSLDPSGFEELLRQPGACFVTLQLQARLRGCIGSLEARRPLVEDVAANAYAAAFHDPRFAALRSSEFEAVEIDISLLSAPEPMQFVSQQDLLAQLQPGIDGLILQSGRHRGTFLPSVWEQLPQPREFLQHLKVKAGLDSDAWPEDIQISRYRTEFFSEQ